MNLSVFFAACIGAVVPMFLIETRLKTKKYYGRAPRVLVACLLPLLSGYVAAAVISCKSPLQAFVLGIMIDRFLAYVRSVRRSDLCKLVDQFLNDRRRP